MSASSALHSPVLGLPHGGSAQGPYGPQALGDDLGVRPPSGGLAVGDRGPRRARDGRPGVRLGRRRPLRTRGGLVPRPARAREGEGGVGGGRRRVPSGAAPPLGHHTSAGAGLSEQWARPGSRGPGHRGAPFGAKFAERPSHAIGRMRTAKGLLVPDRLRAALLACGGRTRT
jgi:hypothetical protein